MDVGKKTLVHGMDGGAIEGSRGREMRYAVELECVARGVPTTGVPINFRSLMDVATK